MPGFLADLQPQIQLIEGAWPAPLRRMGAIEVLVGERLACDKNLLVGNLYGLRTPASSSIAFSLPVQIVGI